MNNNRRTEKNFSSNQLFKSEQEADIEIYTIWYNRDDFVEASINSVLDQTASNFALIAVDDGSTDSTGRRLETTLKKATEAGVPMLVWRKSNEGFTSSLKRAIQEVGDAEVIALHGAGDISFPMRIEKQYNLLSKDEEIVATGTNVEHIDAEGSVLKRRDVKQHPESDPFTGQVPRLGTHGAAMFYRRNYENVGGYRTPFKYAQDVDLLLRLYETGGFRNLSEILYQKLVSEDTVASKEDWKKNYEQIICSAAALESARCRIRNEPDPIANLTDFDLEAMKRIAQSEGPHDRFVVRSCNHAWQFAKSGNIVAATAFLRLAGFRSLPYIHRLPLAIVRDIRGKFRGMSR